MNDNITALPVRTPGIDRLYRQRSNKQGQRFVKGPIPFDVMCKAAGCHPRGLEVWMIAKMLSDMTKTDTVRLTSSLLAQAGVERETKRRALAALENAGLIEVKRVPGRCPLVRILFGNASKNVEVAPQ